MEKIIIISKSDFCILASGLLKRKKPPYMDHAVKAARTKASKSQLRILLHCYWDSLYALTICWLKNIMVPLCQTIDNGFVCVCVCVGRLDTAVVDVGPPADWVKINVQKTVSFCLHVWVCDMQLLKVAAH